jgi:hypothetical protein
MAPATPTSSTSSKGKAIPGKDTAMQGNDIPEDTESEEEEVEQVTSKDLKALKKANRELTNKINEILKYNRETSTHKQNQIDNLNAQHQDLVGRNEALAQDLIRQKSMYKDYIENTASNAARGKDAGEILRPRQPDPYDGSPINLQGFLTHLRAYQMYYPSQFGTEEAKVRHAMGFLHDKALRWFEPIMRDYVNNPYELRKKETLNVYGSYEHFEQELKDFCGFQDEKRMAEQQIQKLRQKGAASTYASEHRNSASRLNWGEEALIASFYRGLKSEVKDAMVGKERPTTYSGLVQLAVEIDDQQFERRQEKKLEKAGETYTPNWKNKKFQANQGKKRHTNTSYGTQSGPMELGAAQRDHSQVKCWNCGKMGHFESKCRSPKTNQKHKPVPEGKNVRFAGKLNDEPRSKTIAMTRSGYDFSGVPKDTLQLYADKLYKTKEEAETETYVTRVAHGKFLPKEERPDLEGSWNGRTQSISNTWTPVPEGKPQATEGRTIAMIRKGTKKNTKPFSPVSEDASSYRRPEVEIEIPDRQPNHEELEAQQPPKHNCKCRGPHAQQECYSHISAGYDAVRARQLGLHIEDRNILAPADEYPSCDDTSSCASSHTDTDEAATPERPTLVRKEWWDTRKYDAQGTPCWDSPGKMYSQLIRERVDLREEEIVHIQAETRIQASTDNNEPWKSMHDDPRLIPMTEGHAEISWMSCCYHRCKDHETDKVDNDCFPIRVAGTIIKDPYLEQEDIGYTRTTLFEARRVAIIQLKDNFYPEQCVKGPEDPGYCEHEECRVHLRTKVQAWHRRRGQPNPLCSEEHAINCQRRNCAMHKDESKQIYDRIDRMHTEGFDFNTKTGKPDDQTWYRELRRHAKNDHRHL